MMRDLRLRHALTGFLALVLVTGCSVSAHKDNSSQGEPTKDVDIRTPFGSIKVHKGSMSAKDAGFADYPGAQLKKGMDKEETDSANVNISSSLFGVKVVVLKFESSDPPEKVVDFYRKDMARYGKVLDCTGKISMNFRRHDSDAPVSCDDGGGSGDHYKQELKVGTENNQRVMAVKPSGNGSEFALVYVRARGEDSDTM
ncbi:MAG: hypothetical protein LAO20_04305 [Acidobacteriia bacterium]|nr:hypothetical protein [Terriglobia bacterium]